MQFNIAMPDTNKLIADADTALAVPDNFNVTTAEDFVAAADKLKIIKGFASRWEEQRKALKAPILEAGKNIDAMFAPAKERLDASERLIKAAMISYETEQKRKREEEQRKADEIARKERERIEAEARKAEAEAKAKVAEIERQAAEARAKGDAEQAAKLAAKAEAVIDKAETRAHELSLRASTVVAQQVATPEPPKIKGYSTRTVWFALVNDVNALPDQYKIVTANQKALDAIAEQTQGAVTIPGVEFKSRTVSASGKA